MANIQVSVINACPVLQDSEVQAIVPSLQKQVSQDFAPAWASTPTSHSCAGTASRPPVRGGS